VDSYSYRIYNKTIGHIEETSNVKFDEDNGSHVRQSGVCDVGDGITTQSIKRMGVGFFRPIEEHLLAEGDVQCSTQVEPLPTEHP
jgi:hypothetical protein